MNLKLTNDERELLTGLLDASIADARQEIYRTEKHAFKDSIRTRKYLMEALLHRLVETEELLDSRNVEITT